MRSLEQWLSEYGESHQNPTNKMVHWVCVPTIFWTVVALLWSVPLPFFSVFGVEGNLAMIVSLLVVLYYAMLSPLLAVGMAAFTLACLWLSYTIAASAIFPLWAIALIVFVLAWILQFWGHKVEGKKPSFLKDLQFLMIGPAWVMSFIFSKAGLKV